MNYYTCTSHLRILAALAETTNKTRLNSTDMVNSIISFTSLKSRVFSTSLRLESVIYFISIAFGMTPFLSSNCTEEIALRIVLFNTQLESSKEVTSGQ